MSQLHFISRVAKVQAGQGGRDVTTHQIRMIYVSYSRSTVHKMIRQAIALKTLIRTKRGYYKLNDDNENLRYIGLCVLLPMDVYEYKSICEKLS